jgi:hypothetical protein
MLSDQENSPEFLVAENLPNDSFEESSKAVEPILAQIQHVVRSDVRPDKRRA